MGMIWNPFKVPNKGELNIQMNTLVNGSKYKIRQNPNVTLIFVSSDPEQINME